MVNRPEKKTCPEIFCQTLPIGRWLCKNFLNFEIKADDSRHLIIPRHKLYLRGLLCELTFSIIYLFLLFFSLLLIDLSVACKAVEVSYSFGLVLQLLRIRNEINLRKESRYTYTNGQFNYIIIHSFISSPISFFLPSFFHQSIHSLICLLMNQSPPRYIKELKGKA